MEKIRVRICTGTACYVQGGSFLLESSELLNEEERSRISVEGASCLGICGGTDAGRPPFAQVGERLVAGATPETLVEAIRTAAREPGRE